MTTLISVSLKLVLHDMRDAIFQAFLPRFIQMFARSTTDFFFSLWILMWVIFFDNALSPYFLPLGND